MMLDAGTGLSNVVLWDLAFVAFAQPTFVNHTTASITTQLWAHFARYRDPNGEPQGGICTKCATTERPVTWYTGGLGLEQRLTIWYTAQPFTEAYVIRPYALHKIMSGCKVLPSGESNILHI